LTSLKWSLLRDLHSCDGPRERGLPELRRELARDLDR
jgi:hypothetical protein